MCGLIEGIADQVRFLSAAEPSPRLASRLCSRLCKKKKKKTAQAARVTLEKSSTNISLSRLMPTRTIIYATQNVLVRMPQTCKCKNLPVWTCATQRCRQSLTMKETTKPTFYGLLCCRHHRNAEKHANWIDFSIFLIRLLYFSQHCIIIIFFCCLSCLTHSDSVLAWTSKNMVICISLSECKHLGLHGRRWNSAGEPTKRQYSKLSAAGVCKDFLNMAGADPADPGCVGPHGSWGKPICRKHDSSLVFRCCCLCECYKQFSPLFEGYISSKKKNPNANHKKKKSSQQSCAGFHCDSMFASLRNSPVREEELWHAYGRLPKDFSLKVWNDFV